MVHFQKKIALITLYDDYNIGNKLQNYALQKSIEDMKFAVETIDMCSFGRWKLSWKGWVVAILGIPHNASHYRRMMLRRRKKFRAFSEQYLNVSKPYSFRKIKNGALREYSLFVCGSDQVWHHWTKKKKELDYFFLSFTEPDKRICYAPSFGFEEVPEEFRETYRCGLMGFNRLSCREQSGCELIQRLTGREAERLCDPTMLLTTEQWDQIARKPEFPVPEKYLLTYFLGTKSEKTRQRIDEIAKKFDLKVVNVYCMDFNEENDLYFCTRPDEFVFLVKHASYVCTDSFHGAVFSILYHKRFAVFQRSGEDGFMMKGRLNTLLELFKLERCINGNFLDQKVDFEYVDRVLETERGRGKQYLHEELLKKKKVCYEGTGEV